MKKILIIISTIIIAIILIIGYCSNLIKESNIEDNLQTNSVYYFKNTPYNNNKKDILIILLNNLNYIKDPKIEEIDLDIDGTHVIRNKKFKNSGDMYLSRGFSPNDKEYFYIYFNNQDILFYFDSKFKLKNAKKFRKNNIDISTVDEDALIDEIYEFVKPIVDSQTEPEVNLQEEFNKRYKDRFN